MSKVVRVTLWLSFLMAVLVNASPGAFVHSAQQARGIDPLTTQLRSASFDGTRADASGLTPGLISAAQGVLPCIAFGPYVDELDAEFGPHPSPALIETLLDVVVNDLGFRCSMTYGVLHGLNYTFQAASARGLQVIAIIELSADDSTNNTAIEGGIQAARAYPNTIIRLSGAMSGGLASAGTWPMKWTGSGSTYFLGGRTSTPGSSPMGG